METRYPIKELAKQKIDFILACHQESPVEAQFDRIIGLIFKTNNTPLVLKGIQAIQFAINRHNHFGDKEIINKFELVLQSVKLENQNRINIIFLIIAKSFLAQAKLIQENEKLIQKIENHLQENENIIHANECLEKLIIEAGLNNSIVESAIHDDGRDQQKLSKTRICELAIETIQSVKACHQQRILTSSTREDTLKQFDCFTTDVFFDDNHIIEQFELAIQKESKISNNISSIFLMSANNFIEQAKLIQENEVLLQKFNPLDTQNKQLVSKNQYLENLKKQLSPQQVSNISLQFNQKQSSLKYLAENLDILARILLFVDIEKLAPFMLVSKYFHKVINSSEWSLKKNLNDFLGSHIRLFFDFGVVKSLYAKPENTVEELKNKYQIESGLKGKKVSTYDFEFFFNNQELNDKMKLNECSLENKSKISYCPMIISD
jgi:hypothetical protein